MSEPGKLSARLERKRPLRFSAQCGYEVPRQACALPYSVLGRRRRWLSRLAVDDPRTIADSPHTRIVRYFQELVDHDPSTLSLARQRVQQWVRGSRNGADESLGGDALPIVEDGRFGRRRGQTGVETNVDSSALKEFLREAGEVLGQLGEDERPGVKQDDADLGRVDAPEAPRACPHEVVQLCDGFDTGEPAAGDHECEERAAELGVRLDVRFFERMDGMVPQEQSIPEVLERQGVLGEPRLAPEARDVTDRNDKVIIFELVGPRTKAGAHRHGLAVKINRLRLPSVEVGVRAESADRRDCVEDSD